MRRYMWLLALIGIGSGSAALAGGSPLAAPNNEKSAAVVAVYERQCTAWADENGLTGEQRENFIRACLKDMPSVLPVGFDESEG